MVLRRLGRKVRKLCCSSWACARFSAYCRVWTAYHRSPSRALPQSFKETELTDIFRCVAGRRADLQGYHRHAVITRTSPGIELIEQSTPARQALPAGEVRVEHLPRPAAHFRNRLRR